MVGSTEGSLDQLMALSRDSSIVARRQLFENVSGLFLSEDDRLSEQERAYISDILTKLVTEIETSVKKTLSEKLALSGKAPHELITLLANDEIDVARPLLFKSRLLMEADLMEIISNRSKEHLLTITERDDINERLSDALIKVGDDDVIEGLIQNSDAEISKAAMAYLVEESKRVDRFQEPLLARHDIPTHLAHKMFWWVSAALRRHIIQNFEIDRYFLDQQVARAAEVQISDVNVMALGDTHADKLTAQLAARNELTEKFLIQSLRGRQMRLFVAGMSLKSGLDTQKVSRFLYDRNAEALAVTCKALEFDRNSFSAIFLLTRRGTDKEGEKAPTNPAEIEVVLKFFDKLTAGSARSILEHWKLDAGYTGAIEQLENQLDDHRVYL